MDAYSSFRHRDYRLLLTGNFVSSFGLQMLSVAVSWDLYVQTKSALVLGNVGFVQVAPFLLFAVFAGGLADRLDRQRILMVTQGLLLVSSALLILGFRSVAAVYACLFLTAAARAFQWPARGSILPQGSGGSARQRHRVEQQRAGNRQHQRARRWPASCSRSAGSRTVYMVQAVCAILTLVCFARCATAGGSGTGWRRET